MNEWASDLLNESSLIEEGFLNVNLVKRRWNEHEKGLADWQHWLWNILMFEAWLKDKKLQ